MQNRGDSALIEIAGRIDAASTAGDAVSSAGTRLLTAKKSFRLNLAINLFAFALKTDEQLREPT